MLIRAGNVGRIGRTRSRSNGVALLPAGARIAFIGDSIAQQNYFGAASGAASAGKTLIGVECGELNWAYAVDPRFNMDSWPDITDTRGTTSFLRYMQGANQGVSGESTTQMLARISEVTSKNADIVIINGGVNDNNGANTIPLSTTKSNIAAMVSATLAANKKVILGTPRPELRAAYIVDGADLWSWAQTNYSGNPNVALWGAYPILAADGPVANDFRDSDLHPGAYGVMATALGSDLSVPSNSLLGCIRQFVASGNFVRDTLWARTSAGTNPTLTGTAGALSTFTGQVPTSWGLVRTSGSFTGVASVAANADTGGQSAVLTITPSGAGTAEEWRFQLGSALSGAAATALQDKWMTLIAEVEHDGNPIFGAIRAELTCNDTNYSGRMMSLGNSTSNAGSRKLRGAVRYWLQTAAFQMPSTLTSVQTALYGLVQSANGASPGVAKIHRVRLVELGDPRTAWGY